jgi:hypothetical protein
MMGVTATQDSTLDRRELGARVTDQCQPEPWSIDRPVGRDAQIGSLKSLAGEAGQRLVLARLVRLRTI